MARSNTFKRVIGRIFSFLLPILQALGANKVLERKIKSYENGNRNFEYMDGFSGLTLTQVQEFHSKSVIQMKSLEDKAKTSIIGVTIAVFLVTGLSGLFETLGENFITQLKIPIIVLSISSLAYMSMAGWMSLIVLGEKNKSYQISPKQTQLSVQKRIELIALYTEQNVDLNIIRNNYVYAAYRSILYAIISLSVIFILIAIDTLLCG